MPARSQCSARSLCSGGSRARWQCTAAPPCSCSFPRFTNVAENSSQGSSRALCRFMEPFICTSSSCSALSPQLSETTCPACQHNPSTPLPTGAQALAETATPWLASLLLDTTVLCGLLGKQLSVNCLTAGQIFPLIHLGWKWNSLLDTVLMF